MVGIQPDTIQRSSEDSYESPPIQWELADLDRYLVEGATGFLCAGREDVYQSDRVLAYRPSEPDKTEKALVIYEELYGQWMLKVQDRIVQMAPYIIIQIVGTIHDIEKKVGRR